MPKIPTCETCKFFVRVPLKMSVAIEPGEQDPLFDPRGECHRHPPQIVGMPADLRNLWPYAWVDDFCGEHLPGPQRVIRHYPRSGR